MKITKWENGPEKILTLIFEIFKVVGEDGWEFTEKKGEKMIRGNGI